MKATPCFLLVIITLNSASTQLQELPGEHDNFEDIRVNSKVYVDKSAYIEKLLTYPGRKFFRMCRPRRFGKSNFLQMLNSYFKGDKKLFGGLSIPSDHDWRPHPVLHFDFKAMNSDDSEVELEADLSNTIIRIAETYQIEVAKNESVYDQLDQLVRELSRRETRNDSVVILVDEYDWPIRRYAQNNKETEVADMTYVVRTFFQTLKFRVEEIKFLFMTCTTQVAVGFPLKPVKEELINYFIDLTNKPEYNEMIGLTEEELTNNFERHINTMVKEPNETFHSLVQKLRTRYDGYCFSDPSRENSSTGTCRLYNFQSVISALRNKSLGNFWDATGDAKYNMIDLYQNEDNYRPILSFFNNCTLKKKLLESLDNLDVRLPHSMIFCMVLYGYLTYRGYNKVTGEFLLDFPNDEVREKFIKELLEPVLLKKTRIQDILQQCEKIKRNMFNGYSELMFELLDGMIFDHEENTARVGKYKYIDRIIRIFQTCDIESQFEYTYHFNSNYSVVDTIDLIAKGPNTRKYQSIFEFNWKKGADKAMKKLLKFLAINDFQQKHWEEPIHAMAISFNDDGDGINDWIRVSYSYVNRNYTHLRTSYPQYIDQYAYITGLFSKS